MTNFIVKAAKNFLKYLDFQLPQLNQQERKNIRQA